ncbi:MAG: RNA polymerase sigma factor [Faecousia sp.]
MLFRNDGKGEANIVQNRFTAYLTLAVKRRRAAVLQHRKAVNEHELPLDDFLPFLEESSEDPEERVLGTYLQFDLKDGALERAIKCLNERERYVFFSQALQERTFQELAQELNMGYKGVAAIYYRAIQKLRREIRGDDK